MNQEFIFLKEASKKRFQEANMSHNYMFQHVMSDSRILKPFVEELIHKPIEEISNVYIDYTIGGVLGGRGISCDVIAVDKEGKQIFNLEMQVKNYKNTIKRARYYESAITLHSYAQRQNAIEVEEDSYNDIMDTCSIWLCMFNPIGEGNTYYWVSNQTYEDGSERIFYDIRNYQGDNKKLQEAFHYIVDSTEEVANEATWEVVKLMHKRMCSIKQDKGKEEGFMKYESAWRLGKEEGKYEGVIEGKMEDLRNLMTNLQLSAYKALEVLNIPEPEWDMYLEKISVSLETKA